MNIRISCSLVDLVFQRHEFFAARYHLADASALRRWGFLADARLQREVQYASAQMGSGQ